MGSRSIARALAAIGLAVVLPGPVVRAAAFLDVTLDPRRAGRISRP